MASENTVRKTEELSKSGEIDLAALEKNASNSFGTVENSTAPSRDLSLLAIIAIGWNICNSWAAIAATLAISVASGGPVTLIYGIIIIFIFGAACALSMAEIASVHPTAGGQYHWTSILAPEFASRGLSYWCGAVNVFGWIATSAGFIITFPTMALALASFWNPGYTVETWHVFLIFQAMNFLMVMYNIFLLKRTIWLQDVGFFLSLIAFFVITITCLAESNPKQSSDFVWREFVNTSGWSSDGVVFLTGLVNPNFIFSGLDGAIHLAEECTNAAVAVPRALISTVAIGFVTALVFAIGMCYSYHDFDAVLASPFPALEIWYQATSSRAVASFFLVTLNVITLFAISGAIQTASRLTWSFARDDAVVLAPFLSRIHPRLGVPVWSLVANSACVFVLGCVYLGSSTAFNALVSTGIILQQLSFAFPAALMLYRRAKGTLEEVMPSAKTGFKLRYGVGPVANVLTMVMALLALVFYDLPVILPVTVGNMNYSCAVIGVMGLLALANWFGYATRKYQGPRMEHHI